MIKLENHHSANMNEMIDSESQDHQWVGGQVDQSLIVLKLPQSLLGNIKGVNV